MDTPHLSVTAHRFIYLFLDGVGLAPASPANPLAAYPSEAEPGQLIEPLPYLAARLGGGLTAGRELSRDDLLLKPIDATLGVAGRPQSATGQTALYTGRNAPAFLGRHLTGFTSGSLKTLIEESGLFKQVMALGLTATSANLYTPGYFEAIERRRLRYSVGALLSMTAGLALRGPEDYRRGEALFWDMTGRYVGETHLGLERLDPGEAGNRLARLAQNYEVTLFESYLTDFAGHARDIAQARQVLGEVDQFIEGILSELPDDTTLIISSDHGNLENLDTRLHTLNPVPLLVFGPAAPAFAPIEDIMGITPAIIELLKHTSTLQGAMTQ